MWFSQKTEAIILTVHPWKEADKRYVALTRDCGKVEFIGRGARKGKAKLAAHLEPFARVQLELVVGRRQTTVIGVERLEHFSGIAYSLEHRLVAQAASSLLDKTLYVDQVDAHLYSELSSFLLFLHGTETLSSARGAFVLGGFLLRLMRHLGYETELHACLGCQDAIQPLSFRWHDARGGLVCTTCLLDKQKEWVTARRIDEEIVTLLRFARDAGYEDLMKAGLRGEHLEHFSSCVHDLLRIHVPGYVDRPYWEMVVV
jgi:DNA repair protein RecO